MRCKTSQGYEKRFDLACLVVYHLTKVRRTHGETKLVLATLLIKTGRAPNVKVEVKHVECELLGGPDEHGKCAVLFRGNKIVLAVNRLSPVNEAAKVMLNNEK